MVCEWAGVGKGWSLRCLVLRGLGWAWENLGMGFSGHEVGWVWAVLHMDSSGYVLHCPSARHGPGRSGFVLN
jgi:hypothetical protein